MSFNMFERLKIREAGLVAYLNSGTMLDVATGCFAPGTSGETILNGGVSPTHAGVGEPQVYKSTQQHAWAIRILERYKHSHGLIHDTEESQKKERLLEFTNDPTVADRLTITRQSDYMAEEFIELLEAHCKDKEDHRKDYIVESPFIDPRTGKPALVWIPTLVGLDSISKMQSGVVDDIITKHGVASSDTNMIFMRDGLIKSKFMARLPMLAARYGLYLMFTAHLAEKKELGSPTPPKRDLQHMPASKKVKQAGADFTYLTSTLLHFAKAQLLLDSNKECKYPGSDVNRTDLSKVSSVVVRNKNNVSGTMIEMVVSQTNGLESGLTNYDYLRESEFFGLTGNDRSHRPVFLPDTVLQRTTAREKLQDPKVERAVELLAQWCYIRNNWTNHSVYVPFNMPAEGFMEALQKTSYSVGEILETRGYWTYDKEDPLPYLSIFDALAIITNQYKPKLLAVTAPAKKK